MNQLMDIFARRQMLADLLLKVPTIKMTLPTLLRVLEALSPLTSEAIHMCFQKDSSEWESHAI